MHKPVVDPSVSLSKVFLAAVLMLVACGNGGSSARHPADGGDDSLGAGGGAGSTGAAGAAGGSPGAGGEGAVAGGTGGGPGGSAGASGGAAGAAGSAGGGSPGGASGAAGGTAGATGGTTSYFYHFTTDGCDTGRLTFSTLAAMCAALESASINHGCALAARQEFFQEECPGTFQEAP